MKITYRDLQSEFGVFVMDINLRLPNKKAKCIGIVFRNEKTGDSSFQPNDKSPIQHVRFYAESKHDMVVALERLVISKLKPLTDNKTNGN